MKKTLYMLFIFLFAIAGSFGIINANKNTPNHDSAVAQTKSGYLLNTTNHVITIYPQTNITNVTNAALSYLKNRADKSTTWTLYFRSGNYLIDKPLAVDNLQNVVISAEPNSTVSLVKSSNWSGEFLVLMRYCQDVTLQNLRFTGKTSVFDLKNPPWGEQGVYFGSSKNITVSNCYFNNFGDAALRIATNDSDPSTTVNSSNIKVVNNKFDNFWQITTTSAKGGVYNYLFQNNQITNMHGSLKFATRIPGAGKVSILQNSFTNSDDNGIEIVGYSDALIENNTFKNIKNFIVNAYTNDLAITPHQWGNNITFKNNQTYNSGRGLRFSPAPYPNGFTPVPKNFVVIGNTFNTVTNSSYPVIAVVNGRVDGVTISGNRIIKYYGKNWSDIDSRCTSVSVSNNTLSN